MDTPYEQPHSIPHSSTVNCQLSTVNSKFALILGNEVKGVHQEVVDACDGCIEIPQFGTKHSLNVSTTAGIVIWEFAKRLLMLVETFAM